jgi:membrane protein YdbS with pleckstrin-like domain
MFENAEISPGDLPTVDSVEWQLMDAKFLRRKLADSAIGFFFALVAVGVLHRILSTGSAGQDFSFGWLWMVPLLLSVPLFTWPLVSVPKKGYAIRERDIIYKSGVFWRTVTAIPFNRIQHVEKSSTPLDRRFQLASLQIFTAGGSGGDLKIHGLSAKTTEKLRFFILEKIGSSIEQE